jgi:hypothetical protein
MSFGVKNGPPTYQCVVISKTFREYNDLFMKIFLDDFTIFNRMETHLDKLKLYFLKCHEFSISLNLEKCVFMVFYGLIYDLLFLRKEKNLMGRRCMLF